MFRIIGTFRTHPYAPQVSDHEEENVLDANSLRDGHPRDGLDVVRDVRGHVPRLGEVGPPVGVLGRGVHGVEHGAHEEDGAQPGVDLQVRQRQPVQAYHPHRDSHYFEHKHS